MNVQVLINVNALPEEIKVKVKKLGDDCYECVSGWVKDNWNKPIDNPIENFLQYGNSYVLYEEIIHEGYKSIADAYMIESVKAAGCDVSFVYHSTREAANQAGCGYENAKKWASKNNVKKITVGNKSMYQWTDENIRDFCER